MMKKASSRKCQEVKYDVDNKPMCPHCHCLEFRTYTYGCLDGGYYFKKLCMKCDNYVMFYTDAKIEKVKGVELTHDAKIEDSPG